MNGTSTLCNDTIVAPATASGEGAIGILRLSGPSVPQICTAVFRPSCKAPLDVRRFYHGHVIASDGSPIDEVMVVLFKSPFSYTGEDLLEIQGHGNPLLMRRIIDRCLEVGCRLARPGEFTQRAFLNGKLDLTQAEAVADLIHSRSEAAQRLALQQLDGRLYSCLHALREPLLQLTSLVEAHLDFPEEELDPPVVAHLVQEATRLSDEMDRLLATFDTGRVMREGLSVLILGRPNVGKSSLLNALLGEARAIVSDIPGTTRDLIEEQLHLNGIPLRLIDTAGLRESLDPVEKEGVRRTRARLQAADLILFVVDGHIGLSEDDLNVLADCPVQRVLLVVNKIDLPQAELPSSLAHLPFARISALSSAGLEELRHQVASLITPPSDSVHEQFFLADRRHRQALLQGRDALQRFTQGVNDGLPLECQAMELRESLRALGEITGETTTDDILERIFSRFCIGK